MSALLFTVRETFRLENRGLILAAEVKREESGVRAGDAIKLRRPDGSSLVVVVAGIERAIPYDPDRTLAVLVRGDLTKADVPVGTEVWSYP
jgi:hypothetical protein